MADINDLGDIGDFEKPPRHQIDISAELNKLSDEMVDAMMEGAPFYEYSDKFPEEYCYQLGEILSMQVACNPECKKQFLIGWGDAEAEMGEIN